MADKRKNYLDIFSREAAEHLAALRQGALALEEEGRNSERVRVLLRHAHTLKGAARMLDLSDISQLSHALEDRLKEVEEGLQPCDKNLTDLMLLATDALEALVDEGTRGIPSPFRLEALVEGLSKGTLPTDIRTDEGAVASEAPTESAAVDTVRIEVERLDRMVNLIGENTLNASLIQDREIGLLGLERELRAFLGGLSREGNRRKLSEILNRLQGVRHQIQKNLVDFQLTNELLSEEADGLRMVPFALLVGDLRRIVRDLARDQDKDITLRITGEEVAIDRMLWEVLRPALIHMLRNAADHGIETPDERRLQGKNQTGIIELSARYQRSGVCIRVRDDGRGIEAREIRQAAVDKGLAIAEQVAELSDEEALYLILRPGFSTREIITDVSGRGIGMDVVASSMERVKGNLKIHSKPGEGTIFDLQLPLTLARMQGLVVSCEGERYVIPLQYVAGVLHLSEKDLIAQGGREIIRFEEQLLPLEPLRDALGVERGDLIQGRRIAAVVLRFREQTMAWAVTSVEQVQELIVKSLGTQLENISRFSGTTLLEDGLPGLILSIPDLFSRPYVSGERKLRREFEAARERKNRGRVLVVDDSVTTRAMERNILETQGYEVEVAISGEEALQILTDHSFDLIVTDIEMPGMDGFELTRRLRQQERGEDLPVIVVTSRASDADKRRGIEVGAQAYIVKGSFDQGKLIEAVETLIG